MSERDVERIAQLQAEMEAAQVSNELFEEQRAERALAREKELLARIEQLERELAEALERIDDLEFEREEDMRAQEMRELNDE